MLERILKEIPRLTEAVVRVRRARQRHLRRRQDGRRRRHARRGPGDQDGREEERREGQEHDAAARFRAPRAPRAPPRAPSPRAQDLPIAGYDKLTADEIVARLPELSQIDLAKVDAYERKGDNRTTVLDRGARCRGASRGPATTSSASTTSAARCRRRDGQPREGRARVRAGAQEPHGRDRGDRARARERVNGVRTGAGARRAAIVTAARRPRRASGSSAP